MEETRRCLECERSFPVAELQLSSSGSAYRCRLCGTDTVRIPSSSSSATTTTTTTSDSSSPPRLFSPLPVTTETQQCTSEKTLASLKVIVIDDLARGLDPQVSLRVAGEERETIAIPAKFGSTSEDEPIEAVLVECDPVYANVRPLRNASEINGKIALVDRGGDVDFVTKAQAVQEAGGVGMLLVQSEKGIFPFTPAPGKGEEEETRARQILIPVACVSHAVGARLRGFAPIPITMVRKKEKDTSTCSICCEEMGKTLGERVLQLPCLHRFHDVCVRHWLTTKASTCPLCRYELEASKRRNQDRMMDGIF